MWSAFMFRDYRVLWLAQIAAVFTNDLRQLAAGFWLYQETGSAAQLGLLGGVQLIVQIPALLFGGTLADRLDRKWLVTTTQGVGFVFVGGMAVLAVLDALEPWHVYVATAVLAVTGVFGNPARSALIAAVVPVEHLGAAVASNIATAQVGTVAAPLAFAAVAEYVNLTAAFVLAAVIAIPAMLLPALLRAHSRPQAPADGLSTVQRTWEGFTFVRRHELLPALYLLDMGVTVFTFYRLLYPVLADQLFGGGAGTAGLLTSANALGTVAGSFAMLVLTRFKHTGRTVLWATAVYGLVLIPFALVSWLPAGLLFITILGGMDAISVTARQLTVQLTTPDAMRGRALSIQTLAAQTANNIGTLEVGLASDAIGASRTLLLGAGVALGITSYAWRRTKALVDYEAP
ncbi:MAG: MFS transporter [Dehalococcoidia bacterium]|nr:MFS transporter [Dehalococcoidia bacterium]